MFQKYFECCTCCMASVPDGQWHAVGLPLLPRATRLTLSSPLPPLPCLPPISLWRWRWRWRWGGGHRGCYVRRCCVRTQVLALDGAWGRGMRCGSRCGSSVQTSPTAERLGTSPSENKIYKNLDATILYIRPYPVAK
jgi:hypothetical protein